MKTYQSALADYADDQFDGASFDGPSFMKTLESLSPEVAASQDTFEGYSAWEVALHVLYYKYYFARAMGVAAQLEPYPYPEKSFCTPEDTSAGSWKGLLSYLRRAHAVVMEAVRSFPENRLDDEVPGWDVPFGKGIAWLCGHDTYHVAHIRNMGIPGLKGSKES